MSKELSRVDIPNVTDVSSGLAALSVPPRPRDTSGNRYVIDPTTVFKVDYERQWHDPYFDGFRTLLEIAPPPITLPAQVRVSRKDIAAASNESVEGKKWTITWTEPVEISVGNAKRYNARCSFVVYHKFDCCQSQANWRINAKIEPIKSGLSTVEQTMLALRQSATLHLKRGGEVYDISSVVSIGQTQKDNILVRPPREKPAQHDSYFVLEPQQFEWCTPVQTSFARASKHSHTSAKNLLERMHFSTQPSLYRLQVNSSEPWFRDQVKNLALIGIPRCYVEFEKRLFTAGRKFLQGSLGASKADKWCTRVETVTDKYRFEVVLPWQADSDADVGF